MKPPAFQFYADDFLAGTCDMSAADVGAYIRLLCYQWNRGSIPVDDAAKLSRIAGCSVSIDVLVKFTDGKNQRMERERQKQADYRELQSQKGKASAQARFNRGSTVVQPTHQPDTQPKGNSPSPSPLPVTITNTTKQGAVAPRVVFSPPSPDEVKAYSESIGYPIDGQAWCDSYAQKGWVVGKSKMKDWKAAVRNWKHNRWEPSRAPSTPKPDDTEYQRTAKILGYTL